VPNKHHAGFTLIEAMIAVVIIGIIAAIAWPTYEAQSRRSKRTDAVKALSFAAIELERCQSDSGAYTGCAITPDSPDGYYTVAVNTSITGGGFTLKATPVAGQAQADDADCATLTLNHLGQKAYTGDAPTIKRCWAQ